MPVVPVKFIADCHCGEEMSSVTGVILSEKEMNEPLVIDVQLSIAQLNMYCRIS